MCKLDGSVHREVSAEKRWPVKNNKMTACWLCILQLKSLLFVFQ